MFFIKGDFYKCKSQDVLVSNALLVAVATELVLKNYHALVSSIGYNKVRWKRDKSIGKNRGVCR
ncbi:MAG: hypothetical protein A2854_02470 [Parcubacteria group bacterium RIFCSPHIGHO2_01_FULL_56_18]|nr:MAG: hypothetical protein A2854_02470 [Parcubacteria group bacterium RIFCSPHIGHO2_01_FULL_56_18]